MNPRFVAGVLALALATSAAAGPREAARTHATIQYAALAVDADPLAAEANPGAVILRVGHRVTEHLAIQGRSSDRAGVSASLATVDLALTCCILTGW